MCYVLGKTITVNYLKFGLVVPFNCNNLIANLQNLPLFHKRCNKHKMGPFDFCPPSK